MSTRLYDLVIDKAEKGELAADEDLMRQVWDPTPWIINVYLGKFEEPFYEHESDIKEWCREHFGKESWPIHGKPGRWHTGGAVVYGWQWYGFDTEEAMNEFIAAWPHNVEKE